MTGGEPAASIAALAWVLTVGAASILLLVSVLALLALRRHRGAPALRWWLGGSSAGTIAVLIALYIYASIETVRLAPTVHADDLVIGVTGHQWWWEIRYRDPAGGRDIATANELHVPVGRRVRLALASGDVIHSFWVPALAGKRDLVPGRITHLALNVERAGRWRGECAEFCGEQHARMQIHVVAHAGEAFDEWLDAQRDDAAVPVTAAQLRGAHALVTHGCVACHAVRGLAGVPALSDDHPRALKAPDLTHVASRATIAGRLPNDSQHRRAWIEHAQALKPGARMAQYRALDAATLDAITAYLEHLR